MKILAGNVQNVNCQVGVFSLNINKFKWLYKIKDNLPAPDALANSILSRIRYCDLQIHLYLGSNTFFIADCPGKDNNFSGGSLCQEN
jgi:hypothetical protein